jgi:hypothetical protein
MEGFDRSKDIRQTKVRHFRHCSVAVIGLATVVFWLRSGVEPTIDLNQQRWKWAYSRTEVEQALGRAMLRTSQYQALVFSAS